MSEEIKERGGERKGTERECKSEREMREREGGEVKHCHAQTRPFSNVGWLKKSIK